MTAQDDDHEARVAAVGDDLLRLRKGRGLGTPDLAAKVGRDLAATLGLDLDAPRTELLGALRAGIVEAAREMPADLRGAVLVGLAVEGWSDEPFLTHRIAAVARAMDRDARTARRRLDAATRMLAGLLVSRRRPGANGNAYVQSGWYVESLASTLHLDPSATRLTEDRVVVAEVDGLDTLYATLSLPARDPATAPDLGVVAEAGCRIRGATRISGSYWRCELALPRPLRAGEAHRYVVSFTAEREAIRPYYVLIPLRRTQRFSAELRFARPEAISLVWLLDGVPQTVVDDDQPTATLLTPDRTGVLRVRFEHVTQGLCYGVRWRWA